MSNTQKAATARYRAAQIQVQALINPQTEPELADAWQQLLEMHSGSKKRALAFAILNAPRNIKTAPQDLLAPNS